MDNSKLKTQGGSLNSVQNVNGYQPSREAFSVERRAANGNYVAYACGPLRRPRYINERIEEELVDFKKEIEERFEKSDVNAKFKFPLKKDAMDNEI